jgi:ribosomal protein S27E
MEKAVKCPACQLCFFAIVGSDAESVTCPQCEQIIVAPLGANGQRSRARLQMQLRVLAFIGLMLTVVSSSSFCLPLPLSLLRLVDFDRSNVPQYPPWVTNVSPVMAVVSVLCFFWIFTRLGEAQSVVSITPLAQSRRILVIGLWLLVLVFAAYVFAVVTC